MAIKQTTRKQVQLLRRHRLVLALAGVMVLPAMPAVAQNLPQYGSVVSGGATIGQVGNQMTITQTTKGAIINWGTFDVAAGSGVTFDQQFGNNSVTLNRVLGATTGSIINGSISANGSVFIINPMGITFGAGSQVNVGSLVASALDIDDAAFQTGVSTGRYVFLPPSLYTVGGNASNGNEVTYVIEGGIANHGQLTAATEGTIAFLGSRLTNSGTITANLGSVVFGAAMGATLDFYNDGLTQVIIASSGMNATPCYIDCTLGIYNSGTVAANGGHVEMRTTTMDGQPTSSALFVDPANGGRIWIGGSIIANTQGTRTGSVILDAGQGNVDIGGISGQLGRIYANGAGAGENGGSVEIKGNQFFTHVCIWSGGACSTSDSLGAVDATAYGAGGNGGQIQVDVNRLYHAGVLQAAAAAGNGGTITINADQAEIHNWIIAEGNGGHGGDISITGTDVQLHRGQRPWLGGPGTLYSQASLTAFGSTDGGTVSINANSISVMDLGDVAPYGPDQVAFINVQGKGGVGGTVSATGDSFYVGDTVFADASGTTVGGQVNLSGFNIDFNGQIISRGDISGGSVNLSTDYYIAVSGTADIDASKLTISAPSLMVVSDAYFPSISGSKISDAALTASLAHGGIVSLDADSSVSIGSGVSITHTAAERASLTFAGSAGVYGSSFSITSTGGPLDVNFLSYKGSNPDGGIVSLGDDPIIDTNGGNILLAADGRGVEVNGGSLSSGTGSIVATGKSAARVALDGVQILTTSGDVTIDGTSDGNSSGVDLYGATITSVSGNISISGDAVASSYYNGLNSNASDIYTATGSIDLYGTGQMGGLHIEYGSVSTGGGDIALRGNSTAGQSRAVSLQQLDVESRGGDINVDGNSKGAGGFGIELIDSNLIAEAGDVYAVGIDSIGYGIQFYGASGVSTTTGDIHLTGVGGAVGLDLAGAEVTTTSGHMDLRGRGMSAAGQGLVMGTGGSLTATSGGLDITGEGGSGAGVQFDSGSTVDAGDGMLVIRAANDGSSDALAIAGAVRSNLGVNLRPGGVDAAGNRYERVNDAITLGGSTGFDLSSTELGMITAPELVIGSDAHAAAISVLSEINRPGNLTLQNSGGNGGIDIQSSFTVGDYTLALMSGGDITQSVLGVLTARSLLAQAGGAVLLGTANNQISENTLSGASGGDFNFLNAGAISIGNVSAQGMNASIGALSAASGNGIAAGGNVSIQNLAGNLILQSSISGTGIDLVTAGSFQNSGAATLSASGGWRVWSNTWVGEVRGGLVGSGATPNLYGCAYLGACGVTVTSTDSHFIYVTQPVATVTMDDIIREYGLNNPAFTFSVTGAILGDAATSVAAGAASTTAAIGSDVGTYAITGSYTSPSGYQINFVPGTLTVIPAPLVFTADTLIKYFGAPNPLLTGTVTGFRNGDTLSSVFGSSNLWTTSVGGASTVGYYPVTWSGSAQNYVIVQAPGNATALQVMPQPQMSDIPIDFVGDSVVTYVYDRNFGSAPICAVNVAQAGPATDASGDMLANEWSKVRSRPNLSNCFDSERRNACGDF